MDREFLRVIIVVSIIVVVVVLWYLPAPGTSPRILHGVVVLADPVQGTKGSRGFVLVKLSDGSTVSLTTSSAPLLALGSTIAVEERIGIFGQRRITR